MATTFRGSLSPSALSLRAAAACGPADGPGFRAPEDPRLHGRQDDPTQGPGVDPDDGSGGGPGTPGDDVPPVLTNGATFVAQDIPAQVTAGTTGTVTAPAIPGSYAPQWQMLQEGVEWFGVATPVATVVVEPATAVPIPVIPYERLIDFQGDFGVRVPRTPSGRDRPPTFIKCRRGLSAALMLSLLIHGAALLGCGDYREGACSPGCPAGHVCDGGQCHAQCDSDADCAPSDICRAGSCVAGSSSERECPGGASTPCSGHGTCSDGPDGTGACACSPEWVGTACDACASGRFGSDCSGTCPGGAAVPCNGQGTCSDGVDGTGLCACVTGWTGPSCDACADVSAATPTEPTEATPGWMGDLAFDPEDGVWLVVSGGGNISGRIMNRDGQPLTDAFQVNPATQSTYAPLVAYSPELDRFLAVWNAFESSDGPVGLYARFVSGTGAMDAPFYLAVDGSLNLGSQRVSDLEYDARNQRFVLVFMSATRLLTIDLTGAAGPAIDLTTVAGGNWNPKVVVNTDADEYCVLYDQRSGGASGATALAMRPVDASTLNLGDETAMPALTVSADLAYNGAAGTYLAVYETALNTVGRVLSSCDVNDTTGGDFPILTNVRNPHLAANPSSNTFGVIGANQNDTDNTYAILDATGAVLIQDVFVVAPVNGQYVPTIAANFADGTFAAVTDRDYTTTLLVTHLGYEVCGP